MNNHAQRIKELYNPEHDMAVGYGDKPVRVSHTEIVLLEMIEDQQAQIDDLRLQLELITAPPRVTVCDLCGQPMSGGFCARCDAV